MTAFRQDNQAPSTRSLIEPLGSQTAGPGGRRTARSIRPPRLAPCDKHCHDSKVFLDVAARSPYRWRTCADIPASSRAASAHVSGRQVRSCKVRHADIHHSPRATPRDRTHRGPKSHSCLPISWVRRSAQLVQSQCRESYCHTHCVPPRVNMMTNWWIRNSAGTH